IEERKESMATGKALDGKPYAGNPHVRFDEGEVAPAAKPRRGSLLYKKMLNWMIAFAAGVAWAAMSGLSAFGATTFTLKSSVSGVDFNWSDGANYVGDPTEGPKADDTIIIPSGVTALMSAEASTAEMLGKINVRLESGAVLKTYHDGRTSGSRYKSSVRTLTGSGTVTTPDSQPADVYADLDLRASCVFDGQIEGKLHYRMHNGVRFTITQNQPKLEGAPLFKDTSELWVGCVGSLGLGNFNLGFNLGTDSTFGYIGAPGLFENLSRPSYAGTCFRVDSGAYGGLTFDFTMHSDVQSQRYVVLKGSNTTESVLGFTAKDGSGPIYMRKEGTGSWKLKNAVGAAGYHQYDGVTDVREGILDFEGELTAVGEMCALGTANRLYRDGADANLPAADEIPYAILLGGEGTEGFLRAASPDVIINHDRLIGLSTSGGFRSSKARLFLKGITAASAGEKTLVLDGDQEGYDAVAAVTNGIGVVSIEKRGTGTWTVRPPCDITGKLVVKEGRLNLGAGPYKSTYDWYRLRLKCNAFQDPLFKDKVKGYYETKSGKTITDTVIRRIAVSEFMFFDAEGNRQCIYPMRHYKEDVDYVDGKLVNNNYTIAMQATNEYAHLCQPGQFSVENRTADGGGFTSNARAFCGLFEGGGLTTDDAYAAGTFHYEDYFDKTLSHKLDIEDESTWVGVILRPADGTPPLVACDLIQKDVDDNQWTGRQLTAFDVCGSTDGLTWDPLLDVHLQELGITTSGYRSGASYSTKKITAKQLANCFSLGKTGPEESSETLELAATVSVAPGATLGCLGKVTISKIALSTNGMGAVEGTDLTLAENGTFVVANLAPDVAEQTFRTSLKNVDGAANLGGWAAVSEDGTKTYGLRYNPETGDVTVRKLGCMLIVR
ncbi:MAG: hypothetical protein IJG84_20410, partial [Kiritimatiellae bacterium]|nr:hypothetical protein [Kiritimatiellia bacterium]